MSIHPTSFVHEKARLAEGVSIGPWCSVGPNVTLEKNVRLLGSTFVEGHTTLEQNVTIYPFCSIGSDPQHRNYNHELTKLHIGESTSIREHVTIHRGTVLDRGITSIGHNTIIMVGCHIAHDCHIGNHVTMTNQVILGGHVLIQDHANIGGVVAIQQFSRIGQGAMVGAFSGVAEDILPYAIAFGQRKCVVSGVNLHKLKQLKTSREERQAICEVQKWIFDHSEHDFLTRINTIPDQWLVFEKVREIQNFVLSHKNRPICCPARELKPKKNQAPPSVSSQNITDS